MELFMESSARCSLAIHILQSKRQSFNLIVRKVVAVEQRRCKFLTRQLTCFSE